MTLLLRPIVCPATGTEPAKQHGDALLRAGEPREQSRLRRVHLRQRRRSVPARERRRARRRPLDRAHRLRDSGAAPASACGRRTSACRTSTRRPTLQRRDGMCWRDEHELYNDGDAFKITCRDARGVIVTVIADNYYGYCKKEVKTQISYAANLFGLCEEEHAGGAIAFPAYVLGQRVLRRPDRAHQEGRCSRRRCALLGDRVEVQPERYAVDATYPDIFYVPENADFLVREGCVRWPVGDGTHQLVLRAGETYVLPWGTKIRLEKQTGGVGVAAHRRLARTACFATSRARCRAAASRRSRSPLASIIIKGPVFVADYHSDMEQVERDPAAATSPRIYRTPHDPARAARPILSGAALARIGDQAADALERATPTSTTHGCAQLPHSDPPAAGHGETLLPARVGRQLARSISRVDRINGFARPRAEVRRCRSSSATTCASATTPTARGASTSCVRTSIPPTRCRSKTTSRPRSCCRARA